MLLLPWPNLPENEQQWQTRSTSHGNLVAALTREYRLLRGMVNIPPRQTDLNSGQYMLFCCCFFLDHCSDCPPWLLSVSRCPAVKAIIQQTLHVLRDLVDSISGESTKSRQICYQSLQESVQVSLSIFPVFIQQSGQCFTHQPSSLERNRWRFGYCVLENNDRIHIIGLKLCPDLRLTAVSLFQKRQMRCWPSSWRSFRRWESRWASPSPDRSSIHFSACSPGLVVMKVRDSVSAVICSFITVADEGLTGLCPREQLAASILQEGSAGCRVVQKFLKILQVVVQEPGQAFKPFLPSILSLCIEQVYPIVAEVSWCFTQSLSCLAVTGAASSSLLSNLV